MNFNLPETLKSHEKGIASTLKSYLSIEIIPSSTHWRQSKFGGLPYLPKDLDYPTNKQGIPLQLLAQINFTETPALENFPNQGILQFYIDGKDDIYGLDFDNPFNQDNFRVVYFPEIIAKTNELITDFNFLKDISFDYSPIRGEFALKFTLKPSTITVSDANFDQYFPDCGFELMELYENWMSQQFGLNQFNHQLGGYPFFTQGDPRFNPAYEHYILLLQIDSDYRQAENEICWGDAGIGNFFIDPNHLKSLDFSQVLYNWDCT